MGDENYDIPLEPIYQNQVQEHLLNNSRHDSLDDSFEDEDNREYESIGSLADRTNQPFQPQARNLSLHSIDNQAQDVNANTNVQISAFMIPLLIFELGLSFVDVVSDFLTGYSLIRSKDNRNWGIGSLVINWIPGVLAVFQVVANHRCDQILTIILYSIASLILCPMIPTLSFIYLLYMAPRNSEEEQSEEFVRTYTRLLSFVMLVRALEGCIESPIQILFKMSLMFNGIVEFDVTKPSIVVEDLHQNEIKIPFFINLLISSACLMRSVYALNMPFFQTSQSSDYSSKLGLLDFVLFLMTSTLFKFGSLILLVGYFNLFAILPMITTFFIGIYVNNLTIREEKNIPNWLLVFMNLFVPICFSTDENSNISRCQEQNLKFQTWNCVTVYGVAMIILGLLVNLSVYNMDPNIPINNEMFNILVTLTLLLGILALAFSFRMDIHKELSNTKKIVFTMTKIIRITMFLGLVTSLSVMMAVIPFSNPLAEVRFDNSNVIYGQEIVSLPQMPFRIPKKDLLYIKGELFDQKIAYLHDKNPKVLIILNHNDDKPSSPMPFAVPASSFDLPTILIKKSDRNTFLELFEAVGQSESVLIGNGTIQSSRTNGEKHFVNQNHSGVDPQSTNTSNCIGGEDEEDSRCAIRSDDWIGLKSACDPDCSRCYMDFGAFLHLREKPEGSGRLKIVLANGQKNVSIKDGDTVGLYTVGTWLSCPCEPPICTKNACHFCTSKACPGNFSTIFRYWLLMLIQLIHASVRPNTEYSPKFLFLMDKNLEHIWSNYKVDIRSNTQYRPIPSLGLDISVLHEYIHLICYLGWLGSSFDPNFYQPCEDEVFTIHKLQGSGVIKEGSKVYLKRCVKRIVNDFFSCELWTIWKA